MTQFGIRLGDPDILDISPHHFQNKKFDLCVIWSWITERYGNTGPGMVWPGFSDTAGTTASCLEDYHCFSPWRFPAPAFQPLTAERALSLIQIRQQFLKRRQTSTWWESTPHHPRSLTSERVSFPSVTLPSQHHIITSTQNAILAHTARAHQPPPHYSYRPHTPGILTRRHGQHPAAAKLVGN
jgi:hypothetical protein